MIDKNVVSFFRKIILNSVFNKAIFILVPPPLLHQQIKLFLTMFAFQ